MVSSPTIFWRCLSLLFWASYVLSRHQTVLNPSQDQSCLGSDTDSKAFSRIMENNDSQDRSICEGTSYIDPKSGHSGCCSHDTHWAIDAVYPHEGKCCQTGTTYSYDPSANNGECCMLGQVFSGTACKSINSPAVSDQAAGPCPSCGNGNVCSYYGNLGIRYGHCYTMKDTSGQEIRRDDGGASEGALLSKYTQADKEVTGPRGLVFRICNSTTNCNQKLDQYVPEGGYWFQLDEQGYRYEADPQPGWMVFLVNTYNMVVSPSPTIPAFYTAANFTGKGTCIFGECAICLQFGASGTPGWLGMTTYLNDVISAPNTRNCKQYYYEETNCIGPSSVAPKT